jgi:GNAT superfamily N-acetyltransferase
MAQQQGAEIFRSWIRPANVLLVAVEDSHILAVGCVNDAGGIILNYVSPEARFRGVSSALLETLELRAMAQGHQKVPSRVPKPPGASTSREDIAKTGPRIENSE